MERIVATCEFGGRTYKLLPRTLEICTKQEALATIGKRYIDGELTIEGAMHEQLDFIQACVECSPFAGIPIEELDVDDVSTMVVRIISGYQAKLNAEKVKPLYDAIAAMGKKKRKKNKRKK